MANDHKNGHPFSRRNFITGTSAAGLAWPDGSAEQPGARIPRSVVVSWAPAAQAINPRVHLGHDKTSADEQDPDALPNLSAPLSPLRLTIRHM
jgi:hypothetical protein